MRLFFPLLLLPMMLMLFRSLSAEMMELDPVLLKTRRRSLLCTPPERRRKEGKKKEADRLNMQEDHIKALCVQRNNINRGKRDTEI